MERRAESILQENGYAQAVRHAYRTVFDDTVRAYGLVVPPSRTDPQFLSEYLRADMGKLPALLPQLYQLYEPVRFGTLKEGDVEQFLALLRRLYTETALARIYDPRFQPSGPDAAPPQRGPTIASTARLNSGRGSP